MTVDRRTLLAASFSALPLAAAAAEPGKSGKALRDAFRDIAHEIAGGLEPGSDADQTAGMQSAIDKAAERGKPVYLPAGKFRVSDLRLKSGTRLIGQPGSTILEFAGGDAFITAEKANGLVIRDVIFDGAYKTWTEDRGEGLVSIANSRDIVLQNVEIRQSSRGGLLLNLCSGRIDGCHVHTVLDFGIKSLDGTGLTITSNSVHDCANNGIQIWQSKLAEDGAIVSGNRIYKIRNAAGGTGEYGNGINVYKAGSVLVQGNRISDCAYSAIRGNAASNIQIVANSCERLGEVAIYSEFEFQGAVIANNIVDTAATGIEVTNFKEGGRLAVIQGNLIRNLFRREFEKEDKRGEGIGVEADATVTGNTIEGAPNVAIQIGWGPYMRNVAATGNMIRKSRTGITITKTPEAGACLVANNLISDVKEGAIRMMDHGVLTGADLAHEAPPAGRITVTGNVVS